LHQRDRALLELIIASLGVGQIYKHGNNSIQLRVLSINDLQVIIKHFDKYPLITQKLSDFLLFKKAIELINRKEHLTSEGLIQLVAIKASMNDGLSPALKAAFPNIIPEPRPSIKASTGIKDPN
jgi:hypothetical protein